MRHHVPNARYFLDAGLHHRHQSVVIHFHSKLFYKREQLGYLGRRIDEEQDPPILVPEIAQHFHFAIGDVVLRAGDHQHFHLRRDTWYFEEVEFLELDVFVFDERFQRGDGAFAAQRWFFVAEKVSDNVFLSFHDVDQRARDRLFALESGHTG